MAVMVAIVGKSGSGKSTSAFRSKFLPNMKGLPPESTVIINVSSKSLPSPEAEKAYKTGKLSEGGNLMNSSNSKDIANLITTIDTDPTYKHIKNIVIDDAQYLQGFLFLGRIREKSFDKFNDVGDAAYVPLRAASNCNRKDLKIFFTYHQNTDDGETKIKTVGKLVDAYLTIEGMFAFVLYTFTQHDFQAKKTNYFFQTQTDSVNTAKSPVGCFEDFLIPNDLGYVVEKINQYYS